MAAGRAASEQISPRTHDAVARHATAPTSPQQASAAQAPAPYDQWQRQWGQTWKAANRDLNAQHFAGASAEPTGWQSRTWAAPRTTWATSGWQQQDTSAASATFPEAQHFNFLNPSVWQFLPQSSQLRIYPRGDPRKSKFAKHFPILRLGELSNLVCLFWPQTPYKTGNRPPLRGSSTGERTVPIFCHGQQCLSPDDFPKSPGSVSLVSQRHQRSESQVDHVCKLRGGAAAIPLLAQGSLYKCFFHRDALLRRACRTQWLHGDSPSELHVPVTGIDHKRQCLSSSKVMSRQRIVGNLTTEVVLGIISHRVQQASEYNHLPRLIARKGRAAILIVWSSMLGIAPYRSQQVTLNPKICILPAAHSNNRSACPSRPYIVSAFCVPGSDRLPDEVTAPRPQLRDFVPMYNAPSHPLGLHPLLAILLSMPAFRNSWLQNAFNRSALTVGDGL